MSQKSKRAVACHVDDGLQKKTRLADTGVLLVSPFLASVSPPLGARKTRRRTAKTRKEGCSFPFVAPLLRRIFLWFFSVSPRSSFLLFPVFNSSGSQVRDQSSVPVFFMFVGLFQSLLPSQVSQLEAMAVPPCVVRIFEGPANPAPHWAGTQ